MPYNASRIPLVPNFRAQMNSRSDGVSYVAGYGLAMRDLRIYYSTGTYTAQSARALTAEDIDQWLTGIISKNQAKTQKDLLWMASRPIEEFGLKEATVHLLRLHYTCPLFVGDLLCNHHKFVLTSDAWRDIDSKLFERLTLGLHSEGARPRIPGWPDPYISHRAVLIDRIAAQLQEEGLSVSPNPIYEAAAPTPPAHGPRSLMQRFLSKRIRSHVPT